MPDAAPLTAAEGGRQVERAHRSHVQEFYDYYAGELSVAAVNQALRAWELTYNTVRPHRALKLKSPLGYLRAEHPERAPHCLKCPELIQTLAFRRPKYYDQSDAGTGRVQHNSPCW